MTIEFTEEMVMNPDALPKQIRGFRHYRQEIWVGDEAYPIEMGSLWLPPYIDIVKVEEVINANCRDENQWNTDRANLRP